MTQFIIKIKLGPKDKGCNEMVVNYDKNVDDMVYDDLLDTVYDELVKEFPVEDYPKADISEIFIVEHENDGEKLYPVLAESQFNENKEKYDKTYEKILVLPEYTYSLTNACKLSLILSKHGLRCEDGDFNMEKMNALYENLKKIMTS